MRHLFRKEQILTIPNLLSLLRLLMIPLIVWLYCGVQKYYAAILVILLSGLTDIADGIIARKFDMVSDFGKVFDPIADKLTQGALIICLTVKYPGMFALLILFAVREVCMIALGCIAMKKTGCVNSAKWYGKAATFILYAVMMLLILFPNISLGGARVLMGLCAAAILFALVMYALYYHKIFTNNASKSR